MPKKQNNEDFSEDHRRLRDLILAVWDSAVDTDGQVAPTFSAMKYWHWELRRDAADAGLPRNSGAANRANKACRRLKRELKTAFDPATELHGIAVPIAEFIIELRTINPFDKAGRRVECLAVHSCCKLAGCPPPAGIGDEQWSQAVMRGQDKGLPKAERCAALANILIIRIRAAAADGEMES